MSAPDDYPTNQTLIEVLDEIQCVKHDMTTLEVRLEECSQPNLDPVVARAAFEQERGNMLFHLQEAIILLNTL